MLTHESAGRYTARPQIIPPRRNGVYRLPVLLTTGADESEFLFNVRLSVFPTGNRILFAD